MRYIGRVARNLRSRLGLTQEAMAEHLDITTVHLSNIENDKAKPSAKLLEAYHTNWGIDLYVMSWCDDANIKKLPTPIRGVAANLRQMWSEELERRIEKQLI